MQKILIAHSSQELTEALHELLQSQFEVISCADGIEALEHIRRESPDALILDIMLPNKDGMTVLEEAKPHIPPVVLATTTHRSLYMESSAERIGIGYIILTPCDVQNIVHRLQDMLSFAFPSGRSRTFQEEQISDCLLSLGFTPALDGFTQLKTGIPLFAKDCAQRLNKELYPTIAKLCGYGSGQAVERSIRSSIKTTWQRSDRQIWNHYFPGNPEKCPTNKEFISRLATLLTIQKSERE